MTSQQQNLIEALKGRNITASWNNAFLNCSYRFRRANGKMKTLKWALSFDDPDTLDGAKVIGNLNAAYVESFARDSFFEALRIGKGEAEATKFYIECKAAGVQSGAPQSFIDAIAVN